jgi:hypothetical protein
MAKSPVYGRGRNTKHRGKRQKNVPIHAAAANINMRGKKSRVDSCWCCVCIDMREDIQDEEHRKEIKKYMKGEET